MSSELSKTLGFVVVAAILTGAAVVNIPDQRRNNNVDFGDLGKKFFPDFTDPNKAASLEVVDWDASTASALPFKVQLKDGKWTIPSHYDYPADGKDRLTKTATGVTDLTRDVVRSDLVEDHEKLGVVDPLDTKGTTLKGQGKRVTLRDAADKVLADFIIGKEVENRPGQRYVRRPDEKRTYAVNAKVDLSTRFADWIETNLLKLDAARVRRVEFDSTKVEIVRNGGGRLIKGDLLTVERKNASDPWALLGVPIPPGKELDAEKLSALTTALGDLKIAGVRTKPAGLTRELMATGDIKELTSRADMASLIARGFYPTEGGKIYSNQGGIYVSTEDGALYTLRFGESYIATGEALSRGIDEATAKSAGDDKEAKDKKPDGVESRYLLVTVAFEPKLLPPLPDPDAGKATELPADVFHHEPGSPEKLAEEKAAKEKADRRLAEETKRVVEAEAKVKELSDRFAGWYYLTPNDAFKGLALNKDVLIRDKSAKPAPGADGPGGFPGLPGFPGGGGGFPGGARVDPHGD